MMAKKPNRAISEQPKGTPIPTQNIKRKKITTHLSDRKTTGSLKNLAITRPFPPGQTDETLRENEKRLQALMDASPIGISWADMEGNIKYNNRKFRQLFGYTVDDIPTIAEWRRRAYPDPAYRETVPSLVAKLTEAQKQGREVRPTEVTITCKDGSTRCVEQMGAFASNQILAIYNDLTEHKLAEKALRESEEKYRTILEEMEEGYFETDLAGNLTFINDAGCRNLGYPREELIGIDNRTYADEENRKKTVQAFTTVYRTGQPCKIFDYELTRKDGIKVIVEVSISLMRDSEGKPIGFRGITRHVTEQRKMEDALRHSEERYRTIVEDMAEGYYEVDLTGKYTFANKAILRFFGYSLDELMGVTYEQYSSPEAAKRMKEIFSEVYRTGIPARHFDSEQIGKDGSLKMSEMSVSLVRNASGKPIGFRGIAIDKTEQKRSEEALRRSEERYRTIIENIQDGYSENDLAGNFTFVNDVTCRNLGYTKEELIGMNYRQYADEENAKKVFQAFNKLYETGEPCRVFDYEITRKDGTKGTYEISVSLIRDSEGKPIGFRGISRDVTEHRRAEEALLNAAQQWRATFDGISDILCLLDQEGRIIRCNKAMTDFLGKPFGEIINRTHLEILHGAPMPIEECPVERLWKTHRRETDIQLINDRWFSIAVDPFLDEAGRLVGAVHIMSDVTEQKRAEEAIRESEKRYRQVIENAVDIIYTTDANGIFTYANSAALTIAGYSLEELQRFNFLDLILPGHRDRVSKIYISQFRERQVTTYVEFPFFNKSGDVLWFGQNASLVIEGEKPVGFHVIARDITERKRAEEALQKSEERYRTILEDMQEVYYEIDLAGNWMFLSGALYEHLGYTKEELIGKKSRQYQDEATARELYQAYSRLYRTGEPIRAVEAVWIRKDGTKKTYEMSASLIRDSEGKPIGFRGISRNITERKRAEEALRKSEEAAGRLAQENAIMAEIGRIVSSTLNVEEVYERFAEEARKLIPFDRIMINLADLKNNTINTAYITGVDVPDQRPGNITPLTGTATEEIIRTRSNLLIQGDNIDEAASRFPRLLPTFQAGLRSLIFVPLISKDQVIGVLSFRSLVPKAYTDRDVRLAESIGTHIAGAIANAQLFIELKRAEEELQRSEEEARRLAQENAIMAEIGRIVSSTLNVEEVYERFAEEVRKLIPLDRIALTTISPDHRSGTMAYVLGVEVEDRNQGAVLPLADSLYEEIFSKRSGILVQTEDESELAERYPILLSTLKVGLRSMISVPLISKGQVIGILHIRSLKPNAYTELDLKLAERVGNQIAGAIANAQLFAERKRAEEALRQSEERYRTIIENIQDGYFEVNLAGNLTFVNDAECVIHGYSRDELIGMNNRQYTDKENTKKVFEAFNKLYRTGEPVKEIDEEIIRKDGTRRFVETSASLIRDSKGEPIGFRGISRDVTGRRQAEEALRRSEERYRNILETMWDGYWETDLAGNFTFVNDAQCRMSLSTRERLIGRNNRQYTTEEEAKKLYQVFNRVYKAGESVNSYQFEFIKRDGTKAYNEISVSLIRDAQGKPIGFRGVSRDITERKKAEEENLSLQEQLRQSQKMEAVGQLAGGVAHDFNNLLTVMKGYSQLSLLDLKKNDPLRGNIQEIEKATQRATDLTRQLLAFSRRQILDFKVLDLNALLKDLEKMLRRIIGEDIELVALLSKDLGRVKIDPSQIEQVIFNLAVNARDAMPSGGKLTIETANVELDEAYAHAHAGVIPGHYVRLSVSDTGVGMSQEVKEKVFEPFFTTKEKGKGTGLGLSMVYGIVKQSNGNIWVYSEPGRGTTFKIYLPRIEEALDTLRGRDETDFSPGGSETVLLAEDDELVRDLAYRLLKQLGYRVLKAANGQEALSVAKEHVGETIHLLLADIVMPQMGGKELADWLKISRPNTKVLYTSGYVDNAIVHHGVLDPGTHFLQKPFSLKTLSNKVREVLDG